MGQGAASTWVCGDGLSKERLQELAHRMGWRILSDLPALNYDGFSQVSGPGVVVLGWADPIRLTNALQLPVSACIEVGCEAFLDDEFGLLTLILTTATAYACDPGTAFTDAMISRGLINPLRRRDIRLALHEAMANGIEHGNLALPPCANLTPDAFIERASVVEARLASPSFGGRPIILSATAHAGAVEIAVKDCGAGFLPGQVIQAVAPDSAPVGGRLALSGRGISFMREHCDGFRHEDGGRRAVLSFRT
jgi:anti-sigma regulatory factor (Ser/Thr protein kinase)